MLKIRTEQAAVFRERATLLYDAKLAEYIQREYPDFFILEGEAGKTLWQFVEHAESRGLKTRRLITMYVELALLFGEDALIESAGFAIREDLGGDLESFVIETWAAAFFHDTTP